MCRAHLHSHAIGEVSSCSQNPPWHHFNGPRLVRLYACDHFGQKDSLNFINYAPLNIPISLSLAILVAFVSASTTIFCFNYIKKGPVWQSSISNDKLHTYLTSLIISLNQRFVPSLRINDNKTNDISYRF